MYKSIFQTLRIYWKDYGGIRGWISSPFFHFSFAIAVLYGLTIIQIDWRAISMASLPTMLGFSLAAYTITFTLMGSALHRALSAAIDKNSGTSLIRTVNATFFHVVFFQTIALVYSLTTKGDFFWRILGHKAGFGTLNSMALSVIIYGGDFVGCFLSIYAILLLFSVAFAMFRLGRLSTVAGHVGAANTNTSSPQEMPPAEITKTWRFAVVKSVAKILRLYE